MLHIEDHVKDRGGKIRAVHPVQHHVAHADLPGQGLLPGLGIDDLGQPEQVLAGVVQIVIILPAGDHPRVEGRDIQPGAILGKAGIQAEKAAQQIAGQIQLTAGGKPALRRIEIAPVAAEVFFAAVPTEFHALKRQAKGIFIPLPAVGNVQPGADGGGGEVKLAVLPAGPVHQQAVNIHRHLLTGRLLPRLRQAQQLRLRRGSRSCRHRPGAAAQQQAQ